MSKFVQQKLTKPSAHGSHKAVNFFGSIILRRFLAEECNCWLRNLLDKVDDEQKHKSMMK